MNEIQSILKELLAADPSLKDREKELLPLLKLLVENKPKAEPTEDFKRRLHAEIRMQTRAEPSESPLTSFFSFLMNKQYSVALAGLLLGVLITGPVVYYGLPSGNNGGTPSGTPLFSYSVSDTGANAFGDFSTVSPVGGRGQGGGGGGNPAPMTMSAEGSAVTDSAGAGADAKMIAPDSMIYRPQVFKFKIDGEIPALTETQVQVMRRNKVITSADAQALLKTFNLGSIDLGSFGSLKTDSVSLYQDGKNGYTMYISFREGSVSINQNWETWDHPESKCTTEACFQQYRIKESDIPADDVLIGIANDFVKAHGIDLTQFGPAEVDNSWRTSLAAMSATDRAMYWFPESARVIYPQLIDGKPVYEQGGAKAGISIGVHVRQKKVSDAYGILSQNRKMDMVFDWDKMLSFEGNSAPYLQYTHARAKSVLRKSEEAVGELTVKDGYQLSKNERVLIGTLLQFPHVLEEARTEHLPHKLANYLYQLAQDFNGFYNSEQILKAEGDVRLLRLSLTTRTADVLKAGAALLTLRVPERM